MRVNQYRPEMTGAAGENMSKRTPLFHEHSKLGAKMIEFGGWQMPVLYTSIVEEHRAVRKAAGVFDISHMGQLELEGAGAEQALNYILTNNVASLREGDGQYTFMLNDQGGVIDDLIVYRRQQSRYLLVVNAAKIDEDIAWIRSHLGGGIAFSNQSLRYGAVALQGPRAPEILQRFDDGIVTELPARNCVIEIASGDLALSVARTGYTGEDGFEIFFPAQFATELWTKLLIAGKEFGLCPAGLGARDTLRMEVCYPLNGADLSSQRTPFEAGLGVFVDLSKSNFLGKSALLAQRESGVMQRLVAIKGADKCPPLRAHYPVFHNDKQIGELTSGTLSPTLGRSIGLGYVDVEFATPGKEIEIEIRGRKYPATVEKKPLYKRAC